MRGFMRRPCRPLLAAAENGSGENRFTPRRGRATRLTTLPTALRRLSGFSCRFGRCTIAQRVHQDGERCRRLPAAWVVEVIAGEGRAPAGKHAHQLAAVEISLDLLF